jgi:molybdopterin converting factor small subunit
MYIILSKYSELHTYFNALGHEIHIARYILLNMLNNNYISKNNNYISKNDTIVTLNNERLFLYNILK